MTALALALATGALFAQHPQHDLMVRRLATIANRETMTEADVAERAGAATAWLAAAAEYDLGELAILRAVAHYLSGDEERRRRAATELVAWFSAHDALPTVGFEACAGRIVLSAAVQRADDGEWQQCERLLPIVLRANSDPRSAYWLLGRRGRDAATPEGTRFLQHVVIPSLLADHTLDDADRVYLLRLMYEVEYTGPRPFVDITGPDLDGVTQCTADHRGRVLLVDYWATWCRPCLTALPSVVAVHRRFAATGLDVIGVSLDDARDADSLRAKVAQLGITFPVIFDGGGFSSAIAATNKVLAIPATFLIDRRGRVRFTNLTGDELARRIEELLAEK